MLDWGSECFYRRLMSLVDDFGRYDGRIAILRAQLYPLALDRVSEPDVGKWIRKCEEVALVRMYTVDVRPYIELLRFKQRLRAELSKWPDPPPISADNCPRMSADGGDPPLTRSTTSPPSSSTSSPNGGAREEHGKTVIPLLLSTEEFASAWRDWMKHRREIKKPVTPGSQTEKQTLKTLEEWGEKRAIDAIRYTIFKGWQGLAEKDPNDRTFQNSQRPVDEASKARANLF